MGMWEFGGICELLFKLPKVGVGAFVFAPSFLKNSCLGSRAGHQDGGIWGRAKPSLPGIQEEVSGGF